jgi:LCP family protein required for cell wall assembly
LRSSRDKSGAVAALLSLAFPGLGQAYEGRRRAALAFAIPVAVLIIAVLAYIAISGGVSKAGFRLLDPNFAAFAAVLSALTAIWWALAIADAGLAGRPRTAAARVVPVVLVVLLAAVSMIPAVPLGAAWLWQVSVADRALYAGDPTLVDRTAAPETPAPSGNPGPSATPPATSPDPSDDPSDDPSPSISAGPSPSIDITHLDAQGDGWLNVFLAGTDQGLPGHVGARTDTMLVVSINNATRDVYMFSFPRDLQTLPIYNGGTFEGKLNTFAGVSKLYPEKFPEPGMKSLAYEVGFLLGVPIDYYAAVNTPGFINLVAAVGSVTVCNERQIDDEGLEFHLAPGIQTLGPEDALSYVRSRHGQGGGDFARAKRQQQVLTALRKEILKPENLARLPELIEAMASVVNTNFPPDQISGLVDLANQVSDEPTNSWVFKDPQWADFMTRRETGGRQVLTPRIDRIAGLSVAIFGEKSLYFGEHPAASIEPDPSPAPEPSGNPPDCADD